MKYQDRSPCGNLTLSDTGKEVTLAGWVDALRDHGEVLFIHLRDRSGIVQIVFTPEATPQAICAKAGILKSEFCIHLVGRVVKRVEGTENPAITTGDIEVVAKDLTILSRAETLPFQISEKSILAEAGAKRDEAVAEDLRLQYRYLDLRRPSMQENLIRRQAGGDARQAAGNARAKNGAFFERVRPYS